MNTHCALCGRVTLNPAVMIGAHPVGPKCAKRAGLMPLTKRKKGVVFALRKRKQWPKHEDKNLDLFEGLE